MYILRQQSIENVGFSKTQKKMAEIIGVSEGYFSKVLNSKRKCSKILAYAITKTLDETKEISDFFERVD